MSEEDLVSILYYMKKSIYIIGDYSYVRASVVHTNIKHISLQLIIEPFPKSFRRLHCVQFSKADMS